MANWPIRLTGISREPGRIPGAIMLPARLFLGVTYLYAGMQKFTDPRFFAATAPGSIGQQLRGYVDAGSPLSPLLNHLAIPHATLIGALIAFAELLIGLSALLGLFTRLGAAGGLAISLIFYLTASWSVHPYFLGGDLPYALAWLILLLAGPGPYSLDEYYFGRLLRTRADTGPLAQVPPRRTASVHSRAARKTPPHVPTPTDAMTRAAFLRAAGTTAALVFAAGVTAVVAKIRTPNQRSPLATASPLPSTPNETPPQHTASLPSSVLAGTPPSDGANVGTAQPAQPAPLPRGPAATPTAAANTNGTTAASGAGLIGNVAALAPNSAKLFTDPASGQPAVLIHLPDGQFVSYSAVCTHEGCTVGYDASRHLLVCPCHRAVFDPAHGAQGISGPSRQPLPTLSVRIDAQGNAYATSA